MEENKCILRFEYIDSTGYKTSVVKEFEDPNVGQFPSLLLEIRSCLLACGFSEALINDYIPDTI